MTRFQLTIITATYRRPKDLYRTFEAIHAQQFNNVMVEHLVVLDGDDPESEVVFRDFRSCRNSKRRLIKLDRNYGHYGTKAKDFGILQARGPVIVFWDDDNWFYPHAVSTICSSMRHTTADLGIFPVLNRMHAFRAIPQGEPALGNFDTACLAVRKTVANQGQWYDRQGAGDDWRYLQRLLSSGATLQSFNDVQPIGAHL